VTPGNDAYEQEADNAADQVMRTIQRTSEPQVQREGDEDEIQAKRIDAIQREEDEDEIQAKRIDAIQREEDEDEIQAKRIDAIPCASTPTPSPMR